MSDSDSRMSPAGSPSADFAAHGESLGDRHLRTLQISYEAVSEGALVSALVNGPCLSSVLGENPEPPGTLGDLGLAPGTRAWVRQPAWGLCGALCPAVTGRV